MGVAENKQLKAQGVKKPASTQEKLQMDKFALEEKVKKLEVTIKDQTKKMNDLQDAANYAKKSSSEVERLTKETERLEYEARKANAKCDSDTKRAEKAEK